MGNRYAIMMQGSNPHKERIFRQVPVGPVGGKGNRYEWRVDVVGMGEVDQNRFTEREGVWEMRWTHVIRETNTTEKMTIKQKCVHAGRLLLINQEKRRKMPIPDAALLRKEEKKNQICFPPCYKNASFRYSFLQRFKVFNIDISLSLRYS